MKNQTPFMFIGHGGTLYASVKIHDLDEGTSRVVNHEDECRLEVEKSAYRECISRGEVICMGTTIAEPIA